MTFGSSANGSRIKYPTQIVGGTGRWTASVSAVASATIGALAKGVPLVCNFIYHSGGNVGYKTVIVKLNLLKTNNLLMPNTELLISL